MATEQGQPRILRIVAAIDKGRRSPMLLAVPALAELIPELREWLIEADQRLVRLEQAAGALADSVVRLDAGKSVRREQLEDWL